MKYVAPTLLAYFAGFFDGEGCVNIGKSKPKNRSMHFQLRALASNTNPQTLKMLQKCFGGKIYKSPHRKRRKPCWQWVVASVKAEKFLKSILPYLVIKKEEAILGLEFRKLKTNKRKPLLSEDLIKREEYKTRLSSMKLNQWVM